MSRKGPALCSFGSCCRDFSLEKRCCGGLRLRTVARALDDFFGLAPLTTVHGPHSGTVLEWEVSSKLRKLDFMHTLVHSSVALEPEPALAAS